MAIRTQSRKLKTLNSKSGKQPQFSLKNIKYNKRISTSNQRRNASRSDTHFPTQKMVKKKIKKKTDQKKNDEKRGERRANLRRMRSLDLKKSDMFRMRDEE